MQFWFNQSVLKAFCYFSFNFKYFYICHFDKEGGMGLISLIACIVQNVSSKRYDLQFYKFSTLPVHFNDLEVPLSKDKSDYSAKRRDLWRRPIQGHVQWRLIHLSTKINKVLKGMVTLFLKVTSTQASLVIWLV